MATVTLRNTEKDTKTIPFRVGKPPPRYVAGQPWHDLRPVREIVLGSVLDEHLETDRPSPVVEVSEEDYATIAALPCMTAPKATRTRFDNVDRKRGWLDTHQITVSRSL